MEVTETVLRQLFAAAPDAMMVIDSTGRVVLANDETERMFGWPARDLVGQLMEVLVPASLREHHTVLRRGIPASSSHRPMGVGPVVSVLRRDGTTFQAEISLNVLQAEEPLVLAAVRDVTDRLQLESDRLAMALAAEEQQAQRLESVGRLAGGVAHDFNNLLGVILNYSELIARSVQDRTVQDDLAEIRAAAERGAVLTRQLLSFARGGGALGARLDLNDVLLELGPVLESAVGDGANLRLETATTPALLDGDVKLIEQVLLNLVRNAREAMPDGGDLTIAVDVAGAAERSQAPGVTIRVTDTGVGMAPETADRAFEPFFTTKARGEGSGLGLATVYGIVRRWDGDVGIESAPGAGTTVTVWLPGSSSDAEVKDDTAVDPRGAGERVLVVEDEAPLRAATGRLLQTSGYDVVAVRDGREALDVLEERADDFDVVLTDVVMPRMGGDELERHVTERWGHLPVIFVSGHAAGAVAASGRTLLDKPVDKNALLVALRKVLDD